MNKNIIQKKMINSIHLKETIDGVAEKSINSNLRDYQILGNTVQDGEPAIDNPVEVVSVGELVTEGENVGKYKVPIEIIKNALKSDVCINTSVNGVMGFNSQGVKLTVDNDSLYISDSNDEIYCSQYLNSSNNKRMQNVMMFFDENKNLISNADVTVSSDSGLSFRYLGGYPEYMVSEGKLNTANIWRVKINDVSIKYMRMSSRCIDDDVTPFSSNRILGTIHTANIYLSEPLRKIGNAQDYIDFRNQKVYRNVRELLLTGEEKFLIVLSGNSVRFYRFQMTNEQLAPSSFSDWTTQKCNYFTGASITTTNTNVGILVYYSVTNGYTYCQVRDNDNFPTVDDFLAFLKEKYAEGNPLVIYYQSYDTIEEDIELPKLPQFKGTTIYQIPTAVQGEFVGTYKTRL